MFLVKLVSYSKDELVRILCDVKVSRRPKSNKTANILKYDKTSITALYMIPSWALWFIGTTLAFGSTGHGFESDHHLFSHIIVHQPSAS